MTSSLPVPDIEGEELTEVIQLLSVFATIRSSFSISSMVSISFCIDIFLCYFHLICSSIVRCAVYQVNILTCKRGIRHSFVNSKYASLTRAQSSSDVRSHGRAVI